MALLTAVVLGGCGRAPTDPVGPAQAARAFVAALEARDASAIVALLEPSDWRGEIGPELRAYLGMLQQIELRDANYRVVEGDEQRALVELRGTLDYSFAEDGASGERLVALQIETVRVEGRWYLRGLLLPQSLGEGASAASGDQQAAVQLPAAREPLDAQQEVQGAATTQPRLPNDPRYPEQWALERVGAPCAWSREIGSGAVTVAVIDSGVDLGHPELVGRLRPDGFDMIENHGAPWDANGHGTHVAGIIAAALDNGEGVAGLAPGVRILPVRVTNAAGVGNDRTIAAGIAYAVERGAQVINLSLGATLLLATPEGSPRTIEAIGAALDAGRIVVVAAGNDFVPLPNAIVGANREVLVVAASNRDDTRAAFSNSGPWIALTAPGEHILSTMPGYEVFLTSAALPPEERFALGYDTMSGTSQAAALVSAAAALLLSAHPDWSAAEVRAALTTHTADIYAGHPSYYRRLRLLGSGRLDACAALGGAAAHANPRSGLLGSVAAEPLAWGAGLLGLILVLVAIGGAGLSLAESHARRRARAGRTAPLPSRRPNGDTLLAAPVAWGELRVIAGPGRPARFRLAGSELLIGRDPTCDVAIRGDRTISRRHARILLREGELLLEDLGSSRGTAVGGRRISEPTPLRSGERLTIGRTVLRFEQL